MVSQKGSIRQVEINSGVSPDFIERTLTQDITTLEALYDLVDNSIDAARNHILQNDYKKDDSGLPANYQGYKVHIRIDKNSVRIYDNCLGIDENTLTKTALYTAATSNHPYGIGYYGLGLKRSLLKMGSHFALSVDDGISAFKSSFSSDNIGGNLDKKIYASEYPSSGKTKSLFSVHNIKPEISNDFHDFRWFENAVNGFAVRYSIYLSKGFEIILHNVPNKQFKKIEGTIPALRVNAKVQPQKETMRLDGVEIVIESGIHEKYIFPDEDGHSLSLNRSLTDYFGIYFVCNDRVIVAASTAKKHGWSAKWHSEYNGFVCWVKFISEEPHRLPWNTSKTALRVDSSLFLTVRDRIKPIADKYRSEIKNRYPAKNRATNPPNNPVKPTTGDHKKPEGTNTGTTVNTNDGKKSTNVVAKPTEKLGPRPEVSLPRDRDLLVAWEKCSITIPENREKELSIFVELCQLSSRRTSITCVVMLRVFLETTAKQTSLLLNIKWDNLAKNSQTIATELHKSGYLHQAVRDLVIKYSSTEGGLFSISNIQSHVHSVKFHPSQSLANAYWTELEPFLAACWKYISEKESETQVNI